MDQETHDRGLAMRRKVLGDAYVDRAIKSADDFNRDFQRLITQYCWGETWGDSTLRDVASFLTRHVRNADYVFRWGGDEFLILLSCREEEAVRKGWELQSEFSRSSTVAALPEGVGLSFGCAEVSALAESATEALHLADERMYADKRAARLPLLETLENVRTGEG